MGAAPMAFVLWDRFMRFNPKNPAWLVIASCCLRATAVCCCTLLYLTGYEDLTLDDLKQFRQWGQNPGHPENFMNPG